MDVLSVLSTGARRTGGPPAFVGGSALALAALGHGVRVLATDLALAPAGVLQRQVRLVDDEVTPSLREHGLETFPARFPRRFAYSPALRAAAHAAARESDVVHIHSLWLYPQYVAYRAAVAAGTPYVVSPHGALDPYLREHGRGRKALTDRLWQTRMFEQAALIHVTTEDEERNVADIAPGVPRAVVPCGIATAEFAGAPATGPLRERLLGGFEGKVVVFVGRLSYKKGLENLIAAFARVRREQDLRLLVVGPDDEGMTPRLERLAADAGVSADVVFAGPLYGEDRLAAFACADAWALPSHTENFGIAVVEAMAAGCPVVISPEVNLADDVRAADAGVVAARDPEPFADGLREVLADDARAAALRERAVTFARRYDWAAVGPQLVAMYESARR